MDIFSDILHQGLQLFLHPMLYIGIILIALQYRRQIEMERKLFSARIHILTTEVLSSIGYGLLGGIIASTLMISIGIVFHPTEMLLVWIVTGILILFHIRFLCLSYSVGIVGLVVGILQLFLPEITSFISNLHLSFLDHVVKSISTIHVPSLIAIAAIMHLIEAVLIKLKASKQATPLFIESKRGKLVGGYQLQSFWLVPLFLMVSTGGSNALVHIDSSWWPLIGGATSFTFFPVPTVIGYSDLTSVYSPKEKSNKAFIQLFIYSVILLVLAVVAEHIVYVQIIASIFAGLGHEMVRLLGRRAENKLPPNYVHPIDGQKVLAILPGSLAEKMGIKEGEILKKVNGVPVNNRQELYIALQKQSAFVKIEYLNHDGHLKFAQHSIYEGDHHQLGILLAPDEDAPYYIEVNNINLFELLKQKIKRISRGA